MGAQWKHAGRIQNNSKKGAALSKLAKEIIVAAKVGDPNPANNARLRAAIEAAKKGSMTRETIERAIKRGSGQLQEGSFELITYEGFAPHRVPVIVECWTENNNRTASEVRLLFRKGQLGNGGSVAWMFDRLGVVEGSAPRAEVVDLETVAIEVGAQNVEPLECTTDGSPWPTGHVGAKFFTELKDLDVVAKALTERHWNLTVTELSYEAKTPVAVPEEARQEVVSFLQQLDEHDDVHRVYAGLN